ncbi:NUDIX hydrolase domain-like protein [Dactylonectria estremocensis]|uniref:NUDIX hydrolase domain-like protein n=1 Tax=Dactylonectria estremocensis TaxID=1079267 RepID=A0A9P9FJE7_9HYPO|nr:NUDIX hydrolase domain-like protein [Dactylonectria estremocensis]
MADVSAPAAEVLSSSSPSVEASRIIASASEPLSEPYAGGEISISEADVASIQNGIHEAATGNRVNYGESSLYYDALTMSPLSPFSAAAIARFRTYKPPAFPLWDRLPVRKRAAVLILLYADRRGDLRVVITMRAASLRSFSGHAAFPGGKADSKEETAFQIARREAWEEIGLPVDDRKLPKPFRIEHLCCLPPSLARTHLVVQPCVALLHAEQNSPNSPAPVVEDVMIPKLDAREVAAVFSAPFYNFLKLEDLPPAPDETLPEGHWYDGNWISWKDFPWRVHNFYVPVNNQTVSKPRHDCAQSNLAEKLEEEKAREGRFKVWGMTARVLVDAARVGYAEEPEMEHNDDYGDAGIIMEADREGNLTDMVQGKENGDASKM